MHAITGDFRYDGNGTYASQAAQEERDSRAVMPRRFRGETMSNHQAYLANVIKSTNHNPGLLALLPGLRQ